MPFAFDHHIAARLDGVHQDEPASHTSSYAVGDNRINITLDDGAKSSLWWATRNEWLAREEKSAIAIASTEALLGLDKDLHRPPGSAPRSSTGSPSPGRCSKPAPSQLPTRPRPGRLGPRPDQGPPFPGARPVRAAASFRDEGGSGSTFGRVFRTWPCEVEGGPGIGESWTVRQGLAGRVWASEALRAMGKVDEPPGPAAWSPPGRG